MKLPLRPQKAVSCRIIAIINATIICAMQTSLSASASPGTEESHQHSNAPAFSIDTRAELDATQKRVDELKRAVGQLQDAVSREEDRNGKLTKELQGDAAAGCQAKLPINTFEILINGAHLPSQPVASTDEQRTDAGNPRQFIFRFGEQFEHTHSDEESTAVFANNGSIIRRDLNAHRIGDIEYIVIEKGGVGVDSEKVCRPGGFLGLGRDCEFQNLEKNIYRIDSLILRINGEVFYRAEAINFTFKDGSLKWADKNLRMNRAFRDLMNKTDCPTQ